MILVWILLIAWGLWLLAPYISRWATRWAARKMQDRFMRSMGLDPEQFKESKTKTSKTRSHHTSSSGTAQKPPRKRKIIPEGYGEYVKFEVFALTGLERWGDATVSAVYVDYREYQISDARYKEIK